MAILKQHERRGRGVRGCSCCADMPPRTIRKSDARRDRRNVRQELKATKAW